MTDTPETPQPATRNESYRLCGACGILIPRTGAVCPECGAPPGSDHPGPAGQSTEKILFGFLTGLVLLGSLALLSLNRSPALEEEARRMRILAPVDPAEITRIPSSPPEQQTDPLISQPPPSPPSPGPESGFPPGGEEGEVASPMHDDPFGDTIPFGEQEQVQETPFVAADPFGEADPPTETEQPPPLSRAERIQQRRAELIEEYTRVLDENHPMHQPGERITLRLTDGTTQTGVLLNLASGQVQLRLPTGEARWFFSRQLAPETRVRVDPSERQTLVQERAWEDALSEMQNSQ